MSDKKPEGGLVNDNNGMLAHWTKINDKSNNDCEARMDHQPNTLGMKKRFLIFSKCDNDNDDLNQCDIKWWRGADFNQTKKKK